MRPITSLPNTEAPDADFPGGRLKNTVGANAGTRVNESMVGDWSQFFYKLMNEAGITPNGLPDSEYSGFQLYQALQGAVPRKTVVEFTTEGDGEVEIITQAQLQSAVGAGKVFSKGSYLGTTENLFVDFQIEVWAFELNTVGIWEKLNMASSGNNVEIVDSTGDIRLTFGSFIVSPAIRIRAVFIG